MDLSLLFRCFVSWFLFPFWIFFGECDAFVLPGRISLDLIVEASGGSR